MDVNKYTDRFVLRTIVRYFRTVLTTRRVHRTYLLSEYNRYCRVGDETRLVKQQFFYFYLLCLFFSVVSFPHSRTQSLQRRRRQRVHSDRKLATETQTQYKDSKPSAQCNPATGSTAYYDNNYEFRLCAPRNACITGCVRPVSFSRRLYWTLLAIST